VKQIAQNNTKPESQLEKQIAEELKRQGITSEKDIITRESEGLAID